MQLDALEPQGLILFYFKHQLRFHAKHHSENRLLFRLVQKTERISIPGQSHSSSEQISIPYRFIVNRSMEIGSSHFWEEWVYHILPLFPIKLTLSPLHFFSAPMHEKLSSVACGINYWRKTFLKDSSRCTHVFVVEEPQLKAASFEA